MNISDAVADIRMRVASAMRDIPELIRVHEEVALEAAEVAHRLSSTYKATAAQLEVLITRTRAALAEGNESEAATLFAELQQAYDAWRLPYSLSVGDCEIDICNPSKVRASDM